MLLTLLWELGKKIGIKAVAGPCLRVQIFYLAKLEHFNVGIHQLAIDPQKIHAHDRTLLSRKNALWNLERLILLNLAGRTDCVEKSRVGAKPSAAHFHLSPC
eukprot:scaffold19891_cov139-Skeletonema_marinoi.AAC.3